MGSPGDLSGALTSATIPMNLIIEPLHGGLLILGLLVVCCAMLWLASSRETARPQPR